MYLDGDEVGGGGGKAAYIFDAVAVDCPAEEFRFYFLGAIGAHDLSVSSFYVF